MVLWRESIPNYDPRLQHPEPFGFPRRLVPIHFAIRNKQSRFPSLYV
jgi:hypothetical protein